MGRSMLDRNFKIIARNTLMIIKIVCYDQIWSESMAKSNMGKDYCLAGFLAKRKRNKNPPPINVG